MTNTQRVYAMSVASVYKFYIPKAQKGGYGQAELDQVIRWLTGYTQPQLETHLKNGTDFQTFFTQAPHPNPNRTLITGKICGVQIEDIEDDLMRQIRYLDKLVDELARGRAMDKILRQA